MRRERNCLQTRSVCGDDVQATGTNGPGSAEHGDPVQVWKFRGHATLAEAFAAERYFAITRVVRTDYVLLQRQGILGAEYFRGKSDQWLRPTANPVGLSSNAESVV